jgi:Peptidase inhibitor family I36
MKRSIRRAATVLAALTLTAGGFAGMPSAAQAADRAKSDCPSGYACAWLNSNFSSTRWQGQYDNPTLSSALANKASSLYNHGNNCEVHWYDGTNFNGGQLNMGRGVSIANLATDAPGWNDTIASMNWC